MVPARSGRCKALKPEDAGLNNRQPPRHSRNGSKALSGTNEGAESPEKKGCATDSSEDPDDDDRDQELVNTKGEPGPVVQNRQQLQGRASEDDQSVDRKDAKVVRRRHASEIGSIGTVAKARKSANEPAIGSSKPLGESSDISPPRRQLASVSNAGSVELQSEEAVDAENVESLQVESRQRRSAVSAGALTPSAGQSSAASASGAVPTRQDRAAVSSSTAPQQVDVKPAVPADGDLQTMPVPARRRRASISVASARPKTEQDVEVPDAEMPGGPNDAQSMPVPARRRRASMSAVVVVDKAPIEQVEACKPRRVTLASVGKVMAWANRSKRNSKGPQPAQLVVEEVCEPLDEDEVHKRLNYVKRFREHLCKHLGDEVATFEALDLNFTGSISFSDLVSTIKCRAVPEEDARGPFDLRRVFHALDPKCSGSLSCDELISAPLEELPSKIKERSPKRKGDVDFEAPFEVTTCPTNSVERFRRLMIRHFKALTKAFKALAPKGRNALHYRDLAEGMLGAHLDPEDEIGYINLKLVFRGMDVECNGAISFSQFCGVWPRTRSDSKGSRDDSKGNVKQDAANANADENLDDEVGEGSGSHKARPPCSSAWMQKIEEFGQDCGVEDLNLKHACVGEWGAERLALAILARSGPGMRGVKVIELGGNYIGDSGVLRLSLAFLHCTLRKLMLSSNGIGDAGAASLSSIIPKMVLLDELILSQNYVGDDGAESFSKVLKAKPKPRLRKLDLQRNRIGRFGVMKLNSVDHEDFRLLLDGNVGTFDNDISLSRTSSDNIWSIDPGYPLRAWSAPRPSSLGCTRRRSLAFDGRFEGQDVAPAQSLPLYLAASLTSHVGDQWEPAAQLHRHLALAKHIGLGKLKRPLSQVALNSVASDVRMLSKLAPDV
mmetsp:Transcript_117714/g.375178  ORF Transcript_117714/g.375178 Transcript_117714/m.375178 type:complete len:894 (+) Transcript_117714:160-2841(+)